MLVTARTFSRSTRRFITLGAIIAVSPAIVPFASAQTAAKKVLSVDDYTKWKSIGTSRSRATASGSTYVVSATNTAPTDAQAGPPPRATRQQPGHRGAERERASVLGRLQMGRVPGRSERWRPRWSRRARRARRRRCCSAGRAQNGRAGGEHAAGTAAPTSSCAISRRAPCSRGRTFSRSRSRRRRATSCCVVARPGGADAGRWSRRRARRRRRQRLGRVRPPSPDGAARQRTSSFTTSRPAATNCSAASARSSFNKTGDLLAYTVDATVRDGNGLFVLDLRNGRGRHDARQRRARLQPPDVERRRHGARGAQGRRRRQDARARQRADRRIPTCRRRSATRRRAGEARSGEGRRLPEGLGRQRSRRARLERRQQARLLRHQGAGAGARHGAPRKRTDEIADVDVWNTDGRADPVGADDARRAGSQLHVPRGVRRRRPRSSSSSPTRRCATSTSRRTAAGPSAATRAATSPTTSGPPPTSTASTPSTGERTLMLKSQLIRRRQHMFGISPDGNYVPLLEGQQVPGVRPRRRDARRRSAAHRHVSFVDAEYDHPGPKPSYGIAGYTSDGKAVIATHRYDLWLAAARRLGADAT